LGDTGIRAWRRRAMDRERLEKCSQRGWGPLGAVAPWWRKEECTTYIMKLLIIYFLHSSVTNSLSLDIFFSTLFLDQIRLFYTNNVRDQVLKYRVFYAIKV
jgi:hypothetical protein